VDRALETVRQSGLRAWDSIRLGGYRVLAGEQDAVRLLLQTLPRSKVGEREYPFQLLGHSAFHTPLMQPASEQGLDLLSDLRWGPPHVPLIDGRGHVFDPRTARPEDLRDYTLGHQVVTTFDFTTSLRVVLREFAPDALVLLGPGDTLGGAIAQILVAEGWSGLRSKSAFLERQRSDTPILFSMGRPEQFARVAAS
jgi:acyl transferase domain-containing protein